MNSVFEIFKISIAFFLTRLIPERFHTRLCRFIYNYNSNSNKGLDWVVTYQPLQGMHAQKIMINTKEFIGWNVLFHHYYEQDTNLILKKIIQDSYYVVEAGAHIGTETLLMADQVGSQGKVFAFEPNPLVMKRLRMNILLNDWTERVDLFEIALGEQNREISFYIKNETISNQGMSSKYRFANDLIEIQTKQQTLDHWMDEHQIHRIDFLKMDVQGAELDILNGASTTIARYKPIIFAEADDSMQTESSHSMKDLYEKLIEYGYEVYLICPDSGLQKIIPSNLQSGNWLALFEDKSVLAN